VRLIRLARLGDAVDEAGMVGYMSSAREQTFVSSPGLIIATYNAASLVCL
jgi:hypothetical protein